MKLTFLFLFLQSSHSPTTAFAKLRFGALTSGTDGLPLTPKPTAQPINEEPEFMHCYSSETKHRNASNSSTPTAPRSLSLHILNCNNSNNSSIDGTEGSPSPNSKASRPMSLSLTRLDEATPTSTQKRPISLDASQSTPLQDAAVTQPKESRTDEMTSTVTEATPPTQTDCVSVAQATPVDFKQPESGSSPATKVQLREHTSPRLKIRPKSVALAQNSPKERVASPMTPTKEYLASPQAIPSNFDMILKYSQETFKSRSLEDSINKADRACLTCSSADKCLCHEMIPKLSVAQSTGSISSAGSHNSLHGSLEVIKVL